MNRYDDLMQYVAMFMPDNSGEFSMRFIYENHRSSRGNLTEEQLKKIEEELSCSLPADYREFLQCYGGVVVCRSLSLPYPTADGLPIGSLDLFYGVIPGDQYDLVGNQEEKSIYFPPGVLEIAIGENGYWCLVVEGDHKGNVFFYDPHAEGRAHTFEGMQRISSTFDEFLNLLSQ